MQGASAGDSLTTVFNTARLPSLSILLVDSNRRYMRTSPPAGYLREPLRGKDQVSIVIVTKCSRDMQPIDFRIYENG